MDIRCADYSCVIRDRYRIFEGQKIRESASTLSRTRSGNPFRFAQSRNEAMKESDRVRHTMGSSPDRRLVEACSNEHLIDHIKVANPKKGPCRTPTAMLHHSEATPACLHEACARVQERRAGLHQPCARVQNGVLACTRLVLACRNGVLARTSHVLACRTACWLAPAMCSRAETACWLAPAMCSRAERRAGSHQPCARVQNGVLARTSHVLACRTACWLAPAMCSRAERR